MEGQVGNIFESKFPHTIGNNNYGTHAVQTVQPSAPTSNSQKTKEKSSKHVNHALRNSTTAVGIGVVLLAPIVILATKGKLPKPVTSFLNKKTAEITKKIAELKAKPQMTQAEMAYLNSLQKTSQTLDSARGLIFNLGPLKDVLLEKGLRTLKLNKLCNAITGFFEKTAVKMTNIAYKKSSDAFALMKESFTQANKNIAKNPSKIIEINGVSHTAQEWANIANGKLQTMDHAYDAFRPTIVNKRYKWLAKHLDGLGDKVFDMTYGNLKNFVSSPKKWTTFITEDLAAPTKLDFSKNISTRKKIITNTREDAAKEIDAIVSTVQKSLDMTNKDSVDIMKRLNKALKTYRTNESAEAKTKMLEELTSIIADTKQVLADNSTTYSDASAKNIRKSLGAMKYFLESSKKGEMEELLEIYSHILPKEEFEIVKKAAKKSRNALNEAVYTESDKFVDKIRDLKSGSALTDVGTGLLVPVASTAIGMSMADTKEKKRSVALNLGVPLLTGLGASMWGTIAMYAAGPSMILGVATSTITNLVCSRIDKHLKSKDAQNLQMAQNQNATASNLKTTT